MLSLIHMDYKLILVCNKQALNCQYRLIVKFLSVLEVTVGFTDFYSDFKLKIIF